LVAGVGFEPTTSGL